MKTVTAFFKLIRVYNLLILALGLSLFYFLLLVPVHKCKLYTTLLPFSPFEFMLFVLSVVLVAIAGSIIYDYYNFGSDKEFKPYRPLAQGFFSLDVAMYLHAISAFAGIGLGFYLGYRVGNFKAGYIYVICVLLLYIYSSYLRKIPLIGNVVVAALMAFVFVLLMLFEVTFLNTISFEGANYVLDMLLWQVKFYGGFFFLLTLAIEIVKDITSAEADEANDVDTIAVQFGKAVAKATIVLVLCILLAGLTFFMRGFIEAHAVKEFVYLTVAVVIPVMVTIVMLLFAKEQKQYARISFLLKIIMLLGVLSIPAFYFFNLQPAT